MMRDSDAVSSGEIRLDGLCSERVGERPSRRRSGTGAQFQPTAAEDQAPALPASV